MWYSRTGHRWQYNTANAPCFLDKQGYTDILRICNTYCFSTATVVTRTRLKVTIIRTLCVVMIKIIRHVLNVFNESSSSTRSSFPGFNFPEREANIHFYVMPHLRNTGVAPPLPYVFIALAYKFFLNQRRHSELCVWYFLGWNSCTGILLYKQFLPGKIHTESPLQTECNAAVR